MNWRSGLFRLWIVLSVFWLITAGVIAIFVWNSDAKARFAANQWAKWEVDCGGKKKGPWCDFKPVVAKAYPIPLAVYPAMVFGPPALLFIFGWAGIWISRGFKSPTES